MGNGTITRTMQLAAAVDNNIATNQTPGGAGNLNLNGSTVSGGVATLDVARRVLLTFAADEHTKTVTLYGTDRNGRTQSEVITPPAAAGTAYSSKDYLTLTRAAVSAAFTGNVKLGTNGIASSPPIIADVFINPSVFTAHVDDAAGNQSVVEVSVDDLSPAWDLANNDPVWKQAVMNNDQVMGPFNMIRLTVLAGTGQSKLTFIEPLKAGRI